MRNSPHLTVYFAAIPRPARRATVVVLCAVLGAICLPYSQAATVTSENGTKFLQLRLPAGIAIPQASWEQLTQAVGLATAAHRDEATAILAAALRRGARRETRPLETKLPCQWVARLLHAGVAAAPEKAADLLEVASSLCPDCADSLQSAVELFSDKEVVNDKNVVDDKNGPATAHSKPGDPAVASNNTPSDPNDLNLDDPEVRSLGYGGFGPGFPGAPGYVGSAPGGGIALPPPSNPPVTAVMNS